MQLGGENLFVSRLRRELRFDFFDILRFLMGLAFEPAVFLPQLGEVLRVAQRLLGRSCSRLLLRVLRALTGLPGFGGVLSATQRLLGRFQLFPHGLELLDLFLVLFFELLNLCFRNLELFLNTRLQLVEETVPGGIRLGEELDLPAPLSEPQALAELREKAAENQIFRSFIGMGYHDCITPAVILRNVLEDPGWYTQYTPYQAEIAQGRLEALLNFQTMVADLTGLPLANASLLDEATAAAEAMTLCLAVAGRGGRDAFFVAEDCHPQTIAVVRTKAEPRGIRVQVGPVEEALASGDSLFGVLVQYPATDGVIRDHSELGQKVHDAGALLVVATDLLALTLLRSPGELGADVAVGSAQRFGVPLGYGGPHAAFFATSEAYKRHIPGRLVGVSRDAEGRTAYRLALQTREQQPSYLT